MCTIVNDEVIVYSKVNEAMIVENEAFSRLMIFTGFQDVVGL